MCDAIYSVVKGGKTWSYIFKRNMRYIYIGGLSNDINDSDINPTLKQMKKDIIGILLSLIAFTNSMAQVMIGGHKPFYDARSQTFLIVTDSTSIENLTADVVPTDNSWSDIRIEGNCIDGSYHFGNATNDRSFYAYGTSKRAANITHGEVYLLAGN